MAHRRATPLLSLTVGDPAREMHTIGLTRKDVWQLKNGYMVLREGVLVIPETESLVFRLARPSLGPGEGMLGSLAWDALSG